jgi:hypothetical protein
MLRVIVENAIQPDCFAPLRLCASAPLREPSLNSYTALQR